MRVPLLARTAPLAAGLALAGAALCASTASADFTVQPVMGCTPTKTTQAFKTVDADPNAYSLAPGGDFETGAAGWTFTNGARVASGNETLGVAGGSRSLRMPIGSTATSPAFCVDRTNPHFRFAYKVDNATLTGFVAYVLYRDPTGKVTNAQLLSSKQSDMAPSAWKATPDSPLATLLPLGPSTQTASVQLKFVSINPVDAVAGAVTSTVNGVTAPVSAVAGVYGAAFNLQAQALPVNVGVSIDSVMIDPRARG